MSVQRTRTPVGDEAWLVTGHADVRRLLDDDRLGRSHPTPETAARTGESALFGGPLGDYDTEFADHARMRELLQPHFSPKRMRALRPRVEELTTHLLDDLAEQGPPADLHAVLAVPLPVLVICELLGVPYEDRDQFRAWTDDIGNTRDGARSQRALGELFGYGQKLVARKRDEPGDDVLSRLCADGMADVEVAGLGMALLFAGHETTVVRIGMGTLMLLSDPGQWQALADDPGLMPTTVEEILRTATKGGGTGLPRYARTDLELDGVTIHAGELVLLSLNAANHDPEVFPDPERADVTRPAGPHVTFGYGIRYCLGAPLARIELQAVFSQLPRRFPALRLDADPAGLAMREDTLTGGLVELPVRW